MKRTIVLFCIFNVVIIAPMDAPSRRSSGRSGTLMARHQRNRSLGDKVSVALSLKNDEKTDCAFNLDELATPGEATPSSLLNNPHSSTESLSSSSSRNLAEKAGENNRNNFTKLRGLAYEALRNIKSVNDDAHKKYVSNSKYAEHFYISWMSLEITKDPRALETLVDEEFKPLRDAFSERMSLIASQKK